MMLQQSETDASYVARPTAACESPPDSDTIVPDCASNVFHQRMFSLQEGSPFRQSEEQSDFQVEALRKRPPRPWHRTPGE